MAQTTTDDHDLIHIPTLDELDRMAGIDPSTRIDAQTRLKMRIDAHQVITAQRELVAQGVRR